MIIKLIMDFFRVLNSNKKEGEVAAGFAFGIMLALIPGNNLLWISIFIIGFFTRLNLAAALMTLAAGKLLTPAFDPFLDSIGYWILNTSTLNPAFTYLYNLPLVPYTAFNNSVVMGGLAVSAAAFYPLWLLFRRLVRMYRSGVKERIRNSRIGRYILKLPIVVRISGWIGKYRKITGKG